VASKVLKMRVFLFLTLSQVVLNVGLALDIPALDFYPEMESNATVFEPVSITPISGIDVFKLQN
jgi:hypothetical protein